MSLGLQGPFRTLGPFIKSLGFIKLGLGKVSGLGFRDVFRTLGAFQGLKSLGFTKL